MKNTVFTIFSFATFILVLSFKKCQGPVYARFIVLVVPLNLFLPSISPTNPPFFQEDSESELWQHASWNSINPRTEFPLALALPRARTQPTEEVGLVVKTVRAFSSHFPGKPRGQRVAGGSFVLVRLFCSFIHRAAFKYLQRARHYRNIRHDYIVSVLQESLFKCPVGSLVVQSTGHYYTLADCCTES